MNKLNLFVDGSVNTKSGTGYGAYLLVSDPLHESEKLKSGIRIRRFEGTSSSRLELQTLLWALGDIPERDKKINVYTDSQTIVGLKSRRQQLEQKDFKSSKGEPLSNADLYRDFYKLTDQMHCDFVKVKGHKPGNQKDKIDTCFTLVDRAARDSLRDEK